jgi:hypothetical protein
VLAPIAGAVSLAQYLDCVRDLLHDPADLYWSVAQKTDYINQGLQKRDRETGQNRVLIPFVTTVGVDTYSFTNLGNVNVFDLIGVNLLYNNLRYVMGCTSLSELNARVRLYTPSFQWAPVAYARYGPQQFIVAPAPAIAYTLEVDCSQITPRGFLVALTDTDPLPAPFDAPVCYWAARMAKYNERAYDEAREFEELRAAADDGRATLLDRYGATNPAEFFAVATECFFERGAELRERHGELYGLLGEYYGQDPAGREGA